MSLANGHQDRFEQRLPQGKFVQWAGEVGHAVEASATVVLLTRLPIPSTSG